MSEAENSRGPISIGKGVRLVDTIRSQRADPEAYLVYADLLTSQGDPRGELIVLHAGAARATDDVECERFARATAAHLDRHADRLLGPLQAVLDRGSPNAITWRFGFVSELTVAWSSEHVDKYALGWGDAVAADPATATAELEAVLRHDSTQLLSKLALIRVPCSAATAALALPVVDGVDHLEIHVTDWTNLEIVVEALAARPRPELLTLSIGMADYVELSEARPGSEGLSENKMNVGPIVGVELIEQLAAATPALCELTLAGARLFDGLVHPNVREIDAIGEAIEGLPFDWYDAGPIRLPRVTAIRHTAVNDDYRATPCDWLNLDPASCPELRELSFFGDYGGDSDRSLFAFLAGSPIVRQLEHVYLPRLAASRDAETLDDSAPAFRHLELVVGEIDDDTDDADFEGRCRRALPGLVVEDE